MMRRFMSLCCTTVAVVGCAKADDAATTDTATGAVAATASPAAISLADVAGKWTVRATPEEGTDTTTTTYVLTATADSSGWSMTFPNRPRPVPMKVVAVSGDSIVTEAGPFESVRRKGLQVTTNTVARIRDGKIVGNSVAHYKTAGADSVLRLRIEGIRTQ